VNVLYPAVKAVNGQSIHAQSQEYREGVLKRGQISHKLVQVLRPYLEIVHKTLHMVHWKKTWI
jgi:hypothetical protein